VRYLAELVAGPSVDLERAVRVLTLAIVAVFDPLAIMLLVAATGINTAHIEQRTAAERTVRPCD
jgi:hypothetical protein